MSDFRIEGGQFLLDGQPFQIISGTIHYFRVVPEYWEDRLTKLRAMGCNTVETYIPWNLHEPQPGMYDFSGALDVARFLRTAQKVGLYAIVRSSPFICAEWEFGGQPAWLLAGKGVEVRTKNGPFLELMDRYYGALFPQLAPLQIDCGGPVILFQVENEYGAYGCDSAYLEEMSRIMRRHGATVPFITCDNFEQELSRGSCPDALPTANFGSGAREKFAALAQVNGGGPLMCTEFWIGWYDAWGDEEHHTTSAESAAAELDALLELGHVNIYMFHGGSNFGFMNGANDYDRLTPDTTSYDYDAPLAEDGSITPKYEAFRAVIAKHTAVPPIQFPPVRRADYGDIPVEGFASLLDCLTALGQGTVRQTPCSMEQLGQSYGYILYTHRLERDIRTIRFDSARDRVQVLVDGMPRMTLFDREIPGEHALTAPAGAQLQLLVENMGRVNYGPKLRDQRKGICGPVLADGQPLEGWEIRPLPLTDLSGLRYDQGQSTQGPAFFRFLFAVEETADTFLDFTGWGKGCAFVNGFNLGRFWEIGPQKRLYLPAPLLHCGENEIILLETEGKRSGQIRLCLFMNDKNRQ